MAGSESSSQQRSQAAGADAQHAQQPSLDAKTAFYKTWKGFVELSYELMVYRHLPWPSLTVQWLPGALQPADSDVQQLVSQCLLLGTQTSGLEANAVLVYDALLPAPNSVLPSGHAPAAPELACLQELPHGPLDVNRARAMPQHPDLIATRSDNSDVLLFRLSSQAAGRRQRRRGSSRAPDGAADHAEANSAEDDGEGDAAAGASGGSSGDDAEAEELQPDYHLCGGHTDGGFGLAWDEAQAGRLLTGGNDGRACVWDVGEGCAAALGPLQVFDDYGSALNAVAWSSRSPGTCALVGESGHLMLRDARAPANAPPISRSRLHHGSELLCVDFDPCNEHWLAAGDGGGDVAIVDLRRPGASLQVLKQHAGAVNAVSWNAHVGGALASGAADGTVLVWDVARVVAGRGGDGAGAGDAAAAGPSSAAQAGAARAGAAAGSRRKGAQPARKGCSHAGSGKHSREDEALEKAPPGLLFCHMGHMGEVADVSWNPDPERVWMLASVSGEVIGEGGVVVQPNVCQVWEMAHEMMRLW